MISFFEHVCACVLLLTTIKENIVKQMELEKLVIHMGKNESGFPTSYHTQKMKSRWIKNLNVKSQTLKLLELNIREQLYDLRAEKHFFSMTQNVPNTTKKESLI